MKKICLHMLTMLSLLLPAACSETPADGDIPTAGGDVVLRASGRNLPAPSAEESAGDGTVEVMNGEYTWTYTKDECFPCRFAGGEGRIYPDNGNLPLQWTVFTLNGPYRFYLDNVIEKRNEEYKDDRNNVLFRGPVWTAEEKARYRAARDTGAGDQLADCDIVWGMTLAEKSQKVPFDLTHCMSRTNVLLTHANDLRDKTVTVRLTDLVLEPAAFNRLNGEVLLTAPVSTGEDATAPRRGDLTLLENAKLTLTEEVDGLVGRTPDFILPPQSAHDGETKCLLKVTVEGQTYSAPVPDLMIHTPENVSDNTWFRPGLHVEIRAHIITDEENPRIEFGPVYVKEWDDVGDYVVPGQPGGIANAADLEELIDLYNRMPDLTEFSYNSLSPSFDYALLTYENGRYKEVFRKLTRYGRHTYYQTGYTGKMFWRFELREDLSISSADFEKFRYEHYFDSWYPFEIDFNGHTLTIDGKAYTAFDEEVKNLLIDIAPAEEEFLHIVGLYNSLSNLAKQGIGDLTQFEPDVVLDWFEKYDAAYKQLLALGADCEWRQNEGKLYWSFTLKRDVVLPDGFEKFSYNYYRSWYPFEIDFNGHTLTVGGKVYTAFDEEVENRLMDIPSAEEEFRYFAEQYNSLIDLETQGFGDLTQFEPNAVLNWLGANDDAYGNLVLSGATCQWKQSEGRLHWLFSLTRDVVLPDGFAGFRKDYFDGCYPFEIDFGGHTINGKSALDDELKNRLLSNP